MALTRAALREMGVTEKEIIDAIMTAHGETVEAAKEKATETATATAQKTIAELQAKIDGKPAMVDSEWKTKHDTLKSEFDTYKTSILTEKTTKAQDTALAAALKAAGANEKLIALIIDKVDRSKAVFDGDVEAGFTVKNGDDIITPVREQFSEIFGTVQTQGAGVATPPKGNGGGSAAPSIAATTQALNAHRITK